MGTSDEQAIANLVFRYADLVDAGDFAAVGALFTDATVGADDDRGGHQGADDRGDGDRADDQGLLQGADAVRRMLEATTRRHADGTPRTAHLVTNLAIEVDGDDAVARSRYLVLMQTETLPLQPIVTGHYLDRFARDAEVPWHFTQRRYGVRLVGDLSQHLRRGDVATG